MYLRKLICNNKPHVKFVVLRKVQKVVQLNGDERNRLDFHFSRHIDSFEDCEVFITSQWKVFITSYCKVDILLGFLVFLEHSRAVFVSKTKLLVVD